MHTPDPGGVDAIAGVEKEREAEVLMLEALEHQVADTDSKEVMQHCGKQVGQKEEACRILDTCFREGENHWRSWPLPEGNHNPWEDECTDEKGLQRYLRRHGMPSVHWHHQI